MAFITSLRIKNFFSIKDEVIVKFEASEYTITQHPYRLFEFNNIHINKLSAFYGANASGKTTFVKALVVLSHVISNKNSAFFPISHKNIYNKNNVNSFIEVSFVLEKKAYSYRVEFLTDKDNITIGIKNEILKIEEKKNRILLNRKKGLFKDLNGNIIKNILFDKVSVKQSFLVESLTRVNDYEEMVKFFKDLTALTNIKGTSSVSMQVNQEDDFLFAVLFSETNKETYLPSPISNVNKDEFHKFLFRFLQHINLDISDAQSEIDIQKESVEVQIDIIHSVDKSKKLDFNLESSGTKMLFKILFNIFYAYKNKTVLVLDELDSMLHPMLVPIINLLAIKNNIQLIYTTHNIHNMKYLYSDEIFLIEKDKQHHTTIKNLKDNYQGYENFEKLYKNRELGGIPNLQNINLDMLVID